MVASAGNFAIGTPTLHTLAKQECKSLQVKLLVAVFPNSQLVTIVSLRQAWKISNYSQKNFDLIQICFECIVTLKRAWELKE